MKWSQAQVANATDRQVKSALLQAATAAQDHYPCMCHDFVWRGDRWELVARPKHDH